MPATATLRALASRLDRLRPPPPCATCDGGRRTLLVAEDEPSTCPSCGQAVPAVRYPAWERGLL